VTATSSTGPGFITVYPAVTVRPNASHLNVDRAGQTIPNLVAARLGHAGRVSLFAQRDLDLIVDVSGYFTGTPAAAERGVPVEPPVPLPAVRAQGFGRPPGG